MQISTLNRRCFLSAQWRNLIEATYAVPPEWLRDRLPRGLHLEVRDGRAFVSLVAFQFLETRVWGIRWPGFIHFPEINLRNYVWRETPAGRERGVCFIREFVPQRLVAWIARRFYNEPYSPAEIEEDISADADRITVAYRLNRAGRRHEIGVTARLPAGYPVPGSDDEHFMQLDRGFGSLRDGRALTYEVLHPPWKIFQVAKFHCDFDCGALYGRPWDRLDPASPINVVLAEGSPVTVGRARVVSPARRAQAC